MPPSTNKNNAVGASTLDKGYIANIANQPIEIYITLDTHLGHVTQNSLNIIPRIAEIATAENKIKPVLLLSAIKQNGAYEPVISTNIIEWSNFFNLYITFSVEITEW